MQELRDNDDWQRVLKLSESKPVIILKHSTTCPISAGAWEEFHNFADDNSSKESDFFFIKVIESRSLSNQIAEDLNIKHESPQAIFIQDKSSVWNTSHSSITNEQLTENLKATL
ncbi:bacillithiol system redox-active protein YtxJ [Salibacterium salarium]|uniref:Bacillithiol system redox-active protein YtxJ n=1 Tax=Salibacterium salarium TaxID=284579 RepID=A0A428N5R8_9BACI|nr:bacillithiol system redox-active protein YtxJ [Salibacterium salarium]RSL33696.1 bacillithiol system redox-active protein YtxJ [Salibacterium salarium]